MLGVLRRFLLTYPLRRAPRPLIPHSAYYFGPPPVDSAYGTDPVGHIGVHHPREIIRIERDYASGELAQFAATYPLEIEGRVSISHAAARCCCVLMLTFR